MLNNSKMFGGIRFIFILKGERSEPGEQLLNYSFYIFFYFIILLLLLLYSTLLYLLYIYIYTIYYYRY
jgi:hypothetical protein